LILEAISKAGYKPGDQVWIAIDRRATEFYDAKERLYTIDGKQLDSAGMVEFLAGWVEKYPICSIEDGCSEDDWEGWKMLSRGWRQVQLVGDDVFVTNTKRFQRGIDDHIGNSILIKVNQIGTLTETIDCHSTGPAQRLHDRCQPPQRRDRGHDDRRPGRGAVHRPDQDRHRIAHRPRWQVQSTAADRRDFGRSGRIRRPSVSAPWAVRTSACRPTHDDNLS
jgi:hypothetical protein